MEQRTSILIADSHYLVRQGLRFVFEGKSKYAVISETNDYNNIIPLIGIYDPDVVVIGLNIHGASAVSVIENVLRHHPRQKVLVLDTNENTDEIIQILQLGVHGYILKQCDHEEILDAVESILNDKNFFCSNVIKINKPSRSAGAVASVHLSEREIQILELISQGLTNNEIADKTFISAHTVASHRKNLMKKFRAKNNVDLVISAIKENFIAP